MTWITRLRFLLSLCVTFEFSALPAIHSFSFQVNGLGMNALFSSFVFGHFRFKCDSQDLV